MSKWAIPIVILSPGTSEPVHLWNVPNRFFWSSQQLSQSFVAPVPICGHQIPINYELCSLCNAFNWVYVEKRLAIDLILFVGLLQVSFNSCCSVILSPNTLLPTEQRSFKESSQTMTFGNVSVTMWEQVFTADMTVGPQKTFQTSAATQFIYIFLSMLSMFQLALLCLKYGYIHWRGTELYSFEEGNSAKFGLWNSYNFSPSSLEKTTTKVDSESSLLEPYVCFLFGSDL